jgi:hypothetical protein
MPVVTSNKKERTSYDNIFHIKSFKDVSFIWTVVAVVVALSISLVIWQQFFPPAGFKISNKVIPNNESLGMSTKIMQHPALTLLYHWVTST